MSPDDGRKRERVRDNQQTRWHVLRGEADPAAQPSFGTGAHL